MQERSKKDNCFSPPTSLGSGPTKKLLERSKEISLSRWKKLAGIAEFKWLLDKLICSSTLRLPMLSGIEPKNLFPGRYNCCKLLSMSIFVGIGPDKSLLSTLSKMRSCIIVIEFGISPVNRLLKRFNVSRWLKFDSVDGSLVRFPMAVGRGPVSRTFFRQLHDMLS